MCQKHQAMVNPPLRKLIVALYGNGVRMPGYEEACANAVYQVSTGGGW